VRELSVFGPAARGEMRPVVQKRFYGPITILTVWEYFSSYEEWLPLPPRGSKTTPTHAIGYI